MATKPTWVLTEPSAGSGDGTVAVSSSAEHTGREARSGVITWKAANCDDVERNVIQAGKPEYTSVSATTIAVDKEGGTVTISGKSNSSKISYELGSGDLEITLPDTYTANGATATNGEAISGDPGASAEFDWSITITVPENTSIDELTKQVIITDGAGNQVIVTLDETAGEPYLIVEEGDIQLDYTGEAVSVKVESNTSWTIE